MARSRVVRCFRTGMREAVCYPRQAATVLIPRIGLSGLRPHLFPTGRPVGQQSQPQGQSQGQGRGPTNNQPTRDQQLDSVEGSRLPSGGAETLSLNLSNTVVNAVGQAGFRAMQQHLPHGSVARAIVRNITSTAAKPVVQAVTRVTPSALRAFSRSVVRHAESSSIWRRPIQRETNQWAHAGAHARGKPQSYFATRMRQVSAGTASIAAGVAYATLFGFSSAACDNSTVGYAADAEYFTNRMRSPHCEAAAKLRQTFVSWLVREPSCSHPGLSLSAGPFTVASEPELELDVESHNQSGWEVLEPATASTSGTTDTESTSGHTVAAILAAPQGELIRQIPETLPMCEETLTLAQATQTQATLMKARERATQLESQLTDTQNTVLKLEFQNQQLQRHNSDTREHLDSVAREVKTLKRQLRAGEDEQQALRVKCDITSRMLNETISRENEYAAKCQQLTSDGIDLMEEIVALRSQLEQSSHENEELKETLAGVRATCCVLRGENLDTVSTDDLAALQQQQLRMIPLLQEEHARRIREECKQAIEAKEMELEDMRDELECKICRDDVASVAFSPCGHKPVCGSCSEDLIRRGDIQCPICRQDVGSRLRIY
eukprot:GFYU01001485.1.p1 GENE.GFYU01001485.1~~GFYU01001485.1.p1  ORF type:complete len:606 (-),score=76.04 GFYU01001485.1:246-2063(-)